MCGLFTSLCVQHTAFKIFEAGFRTILVEDACGDQSRQRHEAALTLYGNYMYEILHSQNLEPTLGNLWKQSRFHTIGFVPSKPCCDNASDTSSVTNATEFSTSHSDSSDDDIVLPEESSSIQKTTAAVASTVLSTMAMMTSMVIGPAVVGSLLCIAASNRSPLYCRP